jgi:hypothetical protein
MKYAELYNLEIVQIHNELPTAWKNVSYPNTLSNIELSDMSWSGNNGCAFYPYIEILPESDDYSVLSAPIDVVDAETKTVTSTRTAIPLTDGNLWLRIRSIRNHKLTATDWTQLPDSPLSPEQRAAYAVYRQELRDITTQPDPRAIVWATLA